MVLLQKKKISLFIILACTGWIVYFFIHRTITIKVVDNNLSSSISNERMQSFLFENGFRNISPPFVDTDYVIENRNLCSLHTKVDLFIMIESHPLNFDRRRAIRETWTNVTGWSSMSTINLFVFGRVKNGTLQTLLEEEFKESNDILQGDFLDSYQNLSRSSIMGMKWIHERCSNAKLIMKVDDDVVVNVHAILNIIKILNLSKSMEVICSRFRTSSIKRNANAKSYVGEGLFKNVDFYPTYCDGTIVMMTNDVIPALLKSVSVTPYFWIEDVFLYGLAMNTISGLKYINLYHGKEIELRHTAAQMCFRGVNVFNCNILVAGAYSGNEIREIWSLMQKHKTKVSRYLSGNIHENEVYLTLLN